MIYDRSTHDQGLLLAFVASAVAAAAVVFLLPL